MSVANPFTKLHGHWCRMLAKNPGLGKIALDLSPVYAYVRNNPESAFGIIPMCKRWLFVSPRWYFKTMLQESRPMWQKGLLLMFGLTLGPFWTLWIHQMANVRDVCWRTRHVADTLTAAVESYFYKNKLSSPLNIDILGAGSAVYAVDSFHTIKKSYNKAFLKYTLVHDDPASYNLAARYAIDSGIKGKDFSTHFPERRASIMGEEFYTEVEQGSKNIIALVGIGDHVDKIIRNRNHRARKDSEERKDVAVTNPGLIKLVGKIRHALTPGGIFIFSFASHNVEEEFLERVVHWRHRYRTQKMVAHVFELAGWNVADLSFFSGPTGVQHLVVAKKPELVPWQMSLVETKSAEQVPAKEKAHAQMGAAV